MMANVSVGALFLAGILPGLLMAILMMLTVAYFAHRNGWGGDIKFEWPGCSSAGRNRGGRPVALVRCGS
jgi:TRAP-type C4-dicarboxylate transport system permease large subunit